MGSEVKPSANMVMSRRAALGMGASLALAGTALAARSKVALPVGPGATAAELAAKYDILDCHHHYGDLSASMGAHPSEITAAMMNNPAEYLRIEQQTRLKAMDEQGVRQAFILPGHAYLRTDGIAGTRRINDGVAAYRDRNPDRFPVAVGVVEPLYGDAGYGELERIRNELKMGGISIHVRFQGVSLDSPWVRNHVTRAGKLGLIPFVHAIADSPENALWKVDALASANPDIPMFILDPFTGTEQYRQLPYVAERNPNLLFDTSLALNFGMIEPLVRSLGADRFVFGTDLYSMMPHGAHILGQILASDLDDAAKAKILGGNARRVLRLPSRQPV